MWGQPPPGCRVERSSTRFIAREYQTETFALHPLNQSIFTQSPALNPPPLTFFL
jgi:hypothetical protein